jgi:hypothetical protein
VSAIPPWRIEALLDDPMVRIVMHADGVTTEDILAALQTAYHATSDHEPAPRLRVTPPRWAVQPNP